MLRLLRLTWVKMLLYLLVVSILILAISVGAYWISLSNQNGKNACAALVLTSMRIPQGNKYVERSAIKPYFLPNEESDTEKIVYAVSGSNFYYECDSIIMGHHVFIYHDGVLYYRFRRNSRNGEYGPEVTFRVDNANYQSLDDVLMSSQLPLMSFDDDLDYDKKTILAVIEQSRVSGNTTINEPVSLAHHVYGTLAMTASDNTITITREQKAVYQCTMATNAIEHYDRLRKSIMQTDAKKLILLDRPKFVFRNIVKYL